MKRFRALLLLALLSCGSETKHSAPATAAPPTEPRQAPAAAAQQAENAGPDSATFTFTGNIGGAKPIPLVLSFAVRDSVLRGRLVYLATKKRQVIELFGQRDEEGYRLFEMAPDGNITGIFLGHFKGTAFEGDWFAAQDGRSRPFRLGRSDTAFRAEAPAPAAAAEVPGSYRFQVGTEGRSAGIDFKTVGDSLLLDGQAVTAGPGYNIADVTDEKIRLRGNTGYLERETGCRIRFRFYKGFLVIDHPGKQYDCGFGLNADIEGVYRGQ